MPIGVALVSPVSGEFVAARIELRVLVPYSGLLAKSAVWPSVSGTMTV